MKLRTGITFVALTLVLLVGVGIVSADFSAEFSPYDDFEDIALAYVHVPSVNTLDDVETFTVEGSERVHDCRSAVPTGLAPAAGSHSVWLQFSFPGGTLTLDTAGSTYDTVMSIYKPAGTFADLQTVACNDNQFLVTNAAKISTALEPGRYFLQISRWSTTPTGSALVLELAVSAVYSGTAPANDNFANAQSIVVGQTIVTKNVEFATEEATEPPHSCLGPTIPSHSVWYTFVPGQRFVHLNISLEGSRLDSGNWVSNDTVLEVFKGSTLETLVSVACNNDAFGGASALTNVNAGYNTPVFIRVSEFNYNSIWRPSSYKIKLTAGLFGGLMTNTDFEDPLGSEWKLKNLSGQDGRLCGFGLGNFGDCAFQFGGVPGENAALSQTISLPANLRPAKGAVISAGFALNSQIPAMNFKATLTIKYTDGTPASKQTYKLTASPGPDYEIFSVAADLKSKKVGKITVKFNNKTESGVFWLDGTGLTYRSGYARSAPAGVLPLPAAPAGSAH